MTDLNPLCRRWLDDFRAANGGAPTDVDRQDRLFSLMCSGSGFEGAWTEADWQRYRSYRDDFWRGVKQWPEAGTDGGYDRFELHLLRLAGLYGSSPEAATNFVRAAGLVWGGIAYEGPATTALFRAAVGDHLLQLQEGASGWLAKYVDDDNPAHHWVAAFLAGYRYGAFAGALSNSVRDLAQMLAGRGGTMADIRLGNVAAAQGAYLKRQSRKAVANTYANLFERMRAEMREPT